MIDEPEDPSRPDNLFGLVNADRDLGAHGAFRGIARSFSPEHWLNLHRHGLVLAGLGLAGLACGLMLFRAEARRRA